MFAAIRDFHSNDDGMEALQVVIILACACVIFGFLKMLWPGMKSWFLAWVAAIMS